MRVYTSNDFTGQWLVGTAAVVVAKDKVEALALITEECKDRGLKFDGTLDELDLTKPEAHMLHDGNY